MPLKRVSLFWMAVGAGLSTLVSLGILYAQPAPDTRILLIWVEPLTEDQDKAIAAVGECLGAFQISLPSHNTEFAIPLDSIDKTKLVCLIDNLQSIKHDFGIVSKNFYSESRARRR